MAQFKIKIDDNVYNVDAHDQDEALDKASTLAAQSSLQQSSDQSNSSSKTDSTNELSDIASGAARGVATNVQSAVPIVGQVLAARDLGAGLNASNVGEKSGVTSNTQLDLAKESDTAAKQAPDWWHQFINSLGAMQARQNAGELAGANMTTPEIVGTALTAAGWKPPTTNQGKMAEAITGGATQAAGGALSLKPLAQVATGTTGKVLSALSSEPAVQGAVGAASSATGEAIDQNNSTANPLEKLGAQLAAGALTGGALGLGKAFTRPDVSKITNPDVAEVMQSETPKRPVYTSQVYPPDTSIGNYLQTNAERLPIIGSAGQTKNVQKGTKNAIEEVASLQDNVPVAENLNYAADKWIANRGERLAQLQQQRQNIIKQANVGEDKTFTSNPDSGGIIQQGEPIPVGGTATWLSDKPNMDNISNQIDAIQQATAKANNPSAFRVLNKRLNDLKSAVQNSDFEGVELNRNIISDLMKDPSLGRIQGMGTKLVNSLYDPLKRDMEDHILKTLGPAKLKQWQDINSQLSDDAQDLKISPVSAVLKDQGSNAAKMQRVLNDPNALEDTTALNEMLKDVGNDPNAKDAIKNALIRQSLRESGLNETGRVNEVAPDEKLIANLRRQAGPLGIFFSKDDADAIKGARVYLESARNIKEPDVTSGSLGRFIYDLPGVAMAPLYRVWNSKPVRNLLIRLKDYEKVPAARDSIIKSINASLRGAIPQNQESQ